jgi:carbamoyltransferase
VRRESNERFWRLLRAFGDLTDVPVLLNTSFNNDAEPIVQTVDDAITCYLTTGLDHLIIGDYLITRPARDADLRELTVTLSPFAELTDVRSAGATEQKSVPRRALRRREPEAIPIPVGDAVYGLLVQSDGMAPLRALLPPDADEAVLAELRMLWRRRLIKLMPAHRTIRRREFPTSLLAAAAEFWVDRRSR